MSELQRKLAQRRSINGEQEDQNNPNFIFTKLIPVDLNTVVSKNSPRGPSPRVAASDDIVDTTLHPLPIEVKIDSNIIVAEKEQKIKPSQMSEELHSKLSRRLSLNGESEEVLSPSKMITVQDALTKAPIHRISVNEGNSNLDAQLKHHLESNKLRVEVEEPALDFDADLASLKRMLSFPAPVISPSLKANSPVKTVARALQMEEEIESVTAASEVAADSSFEDTLAMINSKVGGGPNLTTKKLAPVTIDADASFANLNLLSMRNVLSDSGKKKESALNDFYSPLDVADDESVASFTTAVDINVITTPLQSPGNVAEGEQRETRSQENGLLKRVLSPPVGTAPVSAAAVAAKFEESHPVRGLLHHENAKVLAFDPDVPTPKGQPQQPPTFEDTQVSFSRLSTDCGSKSGSLSTRKSVSLTIGSSITANNISSSSSNSSGVEDEIPVAPLSLGDFMSAPPAAIPAPPVRVEPSAEIASAFVEMTSCDDLPTPVLLQDIKTVKEQFLATHHHSEGSRSLALSSSAAAADVIQDELTSNNKARVTISEPVEDKNATVSCAAGANKQKSLKHSIFFDQSFIDQGGTLVDPNSAYDLYENSTAVADYEANLISAASSDSVLGSSSPRRQVVEPLMSVRSDHTSVSSNGRFDYPEVSSTDVSPLNKSSSDDGRGSITRAGAAGKSKSTSRAAPSTGGLNPRASEYVLPLSFYDVSVTPKEGRGGSDVKAGTSSANSSSTTVVEGVARSVPATAVSAAAPDAGSAMSSSSSGHLQIAVDEPSFELPPNNSKNITVDLSVNETLSTQTTVDVFPRDSAWVKSQVFTSNLTEELEGETFTPSVSVGPSFGLNNSAAIAARSSSGAGDVVVVPGNGRGTPEVGNIITYHTTTTTKTVVTTTSTSYVANNVSSSEEVVKGSSTITSNNNSSSSSSSSSGVTTTSTTSEKNLSEIKQHASTDSIEDIEPGPSTPIDTGSKDISCVIFGFDFMKLFDVKCT